MKSNQEVGVSLQEFYSRFMLTSQMPEAMVSAILAEVRSVLKDPRSTDNGSNLAGQIYEGSEITVREDQCGPSLNKFKEVVKEFSRYYVNTFFSMVGSGTNSREFQGSVTIDKLWIVKQLNGDYNPLHDHKSRSPAGLSGVFYLESPKSLVSSSPRSASPKDRGKSVSGKIQLPFGSVVTPDFDRFILPQVWTLSPDPGKFILFPRQQAHQVSPFSGDGERICLAFNIDVWYGQKGITSWSDMMIDWKEKLKKSQKK